MGLARQYPTSSGLVTAWHATELPRRMALVGLAYYAGAWFGVNQTIAPEGIAVVWPPNAILLAAFLLFPYRQWPLIGLAALAAECIADVPAFPLWAAVAFGGVNLFESAFAAWLIRRTVPEGFDFSRLFNGACFLLFGPLLASASAALLGAAVYVLLGRTDTSFLTLWRVWWFGDALGLLLLTPLIVTACRQLASPAKRKPSRPGLLEGLAIGLLIGILGMLVFAHDASDMLNFHSTPILFMPLGIWAAVRFGVLGASLTVVLISLIAVQHLVQGHYPYPGVTAQQAVWLTQEYLSIVALVSVGLAILLHEISHQRLSLNQKDRDLRTQHDLLEHRIAERTMELERANASLQAANARLKELATTDFLTGLANRRHFEALSQRELQRLAGDGKTASVIMFDLDHFKTINDLHGHDMGDEVLRQISDPVRQSIRPRDLCARSGGEEFAILLSEANREQACQVAERIRAGIAAMVVEHQETSVQVTASLGVVEWNGEDDLDALMGRVDSALYRAKRVGRNRVST